jgi:hypothetical protein
MLVLVADRCQLELTTTTNTREPLFSHEPAHRAVGDADLLLVQLLPDLLRAVATVETGAVDAFDLDFEDLVA